VHERARFAERDGYDDRVIYQSARFTYGSRTVSQRRSGRADVIEQGNALCGDARGVARKSPVRGKTLGSRTSALRISRPV